tara:strand:- start:3678 stop:4124 length:447 start_codon:yes stop_codon:yes gene_type:complete
MSYDTVESGLLTLVRVLSNYDTTNSDRGDYRVLGTGVTRAVVLNPGSISNREVVALPRRVQTEWEIIIELFVPFSGEISIASAAIRTDRQELLDHLDKYPTLNGVSGVVHAFVRGGSDPEVWAGESSSYWKQSLVMRILENQTVVIAE